MVKPLLVIAWGNLARSDDAAGLQFAQALRRAMSPEQAARVEILEGQQLTPEMALDLVGRERVLLADADLSAAVPFEVAGVAPQRDVSLVSHALSPGALLAVYLQLHGTQVPPVTLLRLHAERFGLGLPMSDTTSAALPAAVLWALRWVDGTEAAARPGVSG